MKCFKLFSVIALSSSLLGLSITELNASEQVNIYSARKEALIKPLLDKFSEQTGIKVNLVTGKGDALLTRLKTEGKNAPADLLITVDAGRLHRAVEADVLQSVESKTLDQRVPEQYREKNNRWFGISLRSRVIVYAKDRVKPEQLSSYEDLANQKWNKRICIRSSNNIYNQSLVASLIAHNGVEKTEQWAKQVVGNFARPPQGGDRDQIKAVAAGQCDIAVVNSYYLGAMLQSGDEQERTVANKVALFWPNQDDRGAHFNVSGVGVTKAAKHKDNAIKLIEFLTTEESQQWYAKVNNEYPVVKTVPASEILESWGDFKADSIAVEKLGELNAEAVKLMDRVNWR